MSGIAGIYHLDGRPVDLALLRRMTDIIGHRGPDGAGYWLDGPVGLGHRMLHTTPESLRETQPLLDETGNLCLTLDGRVDNREELRTALEDKGTKLRTDTDAELVLQAYECWGEECPKKMIGDFAFVIWDGRMRQLFCARDPLGVKPFYYYTDGRTFLYGSELRQLFEHTAVRREPNEGMIGEYLACAITDNQETLYWDVFRLPPAHFLLVQPGQLQKERYWDIDPARKIWYRTDGEYAEHFLDIFKEAVRCRLRSYGRVGAELSGGVDSSSIVGVIQSLYCEQGLTNSGFETFSLVFPGLPCDESAYIQDVVRMWNVKSNTVRPDESETSCYAEEVRRYLDFPEDPNGVVSYSLMSLAREKGFRVVLTGSGGDEWFTGSFYHYADFMRHLKIPSLIRQLRYDRQLSDDSGVPAVIFPSLPLLRVGLLPLVPQTARRVIKWALRRDGMPPWIAAPFARRIQLAERLRKNNTRPQFQSFAQEDIHSTLVSGWLSQGKESGNRSQSWFGLERRHPFLDRRVVEFAFALPEEQRWRRDQPKFVLRQAMQGLLPETITQRLTKADFSHVFVEAFHALGGERLFDSLTIASIGWVDGAQVREMYRQMAQGYAQLDRGYISHVWKLWMIFGIELWFNTVFPNGKVFLPAGVRIQKAHVRPIQSSA
jgi:asparagine synthase (glutamine-hydrolysing)